MSCESMTSSKKKRIVRVCCFAHTPCEKCKKIKIIQKGVRKWNDDNKKIKQIIYKKDKITYYCINSFEGKDRSKNDSNNKKRENIIACVINGKIPEEYYKRSRRWYNLKKEIDLYIENLCENTGITSIDTIECVPKAGRGHHYDFNLIINGSQEFALEFKFNASSVDDTPQFVSPMKPSQYLESSYEEHYYDNYFIGLVNEYKLPLPTKEEYLKHIHSPSPLCVKEHQEKYYGGCKKSSKYTGEENDIKFYEDSKKASRDSITSFISKYDLNKDKLTQYLLDTQKNKFYMLYKDGKFNLETINLDDYTITTITREPEKSRYIAKTKSDKNLKILLRWKNGNGIAFPSFQIS